MSDSSVKKCKGCGAPLQTHDPEQLGYTPKEDMEYCQRCFRMMHYDKHADPKVEPLKELSFLKGLKGQFFWIVDITDLETSLNSAFVGFYKEQKCTLIVNKCDLLPEVIKPEKIIKYVTARLKELEINSNGIVVRGFKRSFHDDFRQNVHDERLIMTGLSNVGKSTVINDLLGENRLTVSRHPSTTLNVNELDTEFGTVVDTVGLVVDNSFQGHLKTGALKKVLPISRIRQRIYQLNGSQTLFLGGLAAVTLKECEKVTAVIYVSNLLTVSRSKTERALIRWKKKGELSPVIPGKEKKVIVQSEKGKTDVCIAGLGWLTIKGQLKGIEVSLNEKIDVYSRKAMI